MNISLADPSANRVARFALRCGLAVESLQQDYGIDLAVFTFDANEHAFSKLRGATVTVRVPLENVVDEDAMRAFAREKSALLGH